MPNEKRGFLRLVWDSVAGNKLRSDAPSIQIDLFEDKSEYSVLVIYFSDIDSESFSNALRNTHPSHIIDMRANPRFDIAGYSRKIAFTEFESIGAKYMDYLELLDKDEKDKNQLISAIENKVFNNIERGPFAFIFGKKEHDETYEEELISRLPKINHNWSLSIVPK